MAEGVVGSTRSGGGGVDLEGGVLLGKGGVTVVERKLLVRIIST